MMTQQSRTQDDRTKSGRGHNGGVADDVTEKAREIGGQALDRADEWLRPVGLSIKERPMTCLAVVGGLAFAAGAFWMLRNFQQQSHRSQFNDVVAQLPELYRRSRWW